MSRRLALALLLGTAALAEAQAPVTPLQPGNTKNQEVTGAVGATTVVTLTATAASRAHLLNLDYRCSQGTAQVTITDGPTGPTLWSSPPSFIGTTVGTKAWFPPLAGSINSNMVITLSACGGLNASGTLDVQAHVGP